MKKHLKKFIAPTLSKRYMARIVIVSLIAFVLFNYIILPIHIKGHSMEPTYRDGRFNFCLRLKYVFSEPEQFDIVAIRFAGKRVLLLKRIVALEGDLVEIRDGILFVNEKKVDEPYVSKPSAWNLSPRRVDKNHVYVIGDNRSVPIRIHKFEQTHIRRIIGGPLW